MEARSSESVSKDKYIKMYQENLEKYFIRSIIFERLPKYDEEIENYYKIREQTERSYIPHLIAFATGVIGFHLGVINRFSGKGLSISKVFYYTTNALILNGAIHHFVYQKCLKPHTEKLSRKYESFLLRDYPDLQTLKENYRLEDTEHLEVRT